MYKLRHLKNLHSQFSNILKIVLDIVARPKETNLIYTKYTCSYLGPFILFCICYAKSAAKFPMELCINDNVFYITS